MKLNKTNLNKINELVEQYEEYKDYIKGYNLSPGQDLLSGIRQSHPRQPFTKEHREALEREVKDFALEYHKKIFAKIDGFIRDIEDQLKELGYDYGRRFGAEKQMTARILKGDLEGKQPPKDKDKDTDTTDWDKMLKDIAREPQKNWGQPTWVAPGEWSDNTNGLKFGEITSTRYGTGYSSITKDTTS